MNISDMATPKQRAHRDRVHAKFLRSQRAIAGRARRARWSSDQAEQERLETARQVDELIARKSGLSERLPGQTVRHNEPGEVPPPPDAKPTTTTETKFEDEDLVFAE